MFIFLIGMPAAGKSTIAKKLAQRMRIATVDLDEYIVSKASQSIATIFQEKGEDFFRALERDALRECVQTSAKIIVATGGGTPCFYDNLAFMKQKGLVIFMDIPLETLAQRIVQQPTQRPMFEGQNTVQIAETLKKIYQKRLPFYRKADLCFTPKQILL